MNAASGSSVLTRTHTHRGSPAADSSDGLAEQTASGRSPGGVTHLRGWHGGGFLDCRLLSDGGQGVVNGSSRVVVEYCTRRTERGNTKGTAEMRRRSSPGGGGKGAGFNFIRASVLWKIIIIIQKNKNKTLPAACPIRVTGLRCRAKASPASPRLRCWNAQKGTREFANKV